MSDAIFTTGFAFYFCNIWNLLSYRFAIPTVINVCLFSSKFIHLTQLLGQLLEKWAKSMHLHFNILHFGKKTYFHIGFWWHRLCILRCLRCWSINICWFPTYVQDLWGIIMTPGLSYFNAQNSIFIPFFTFSHTEYNDWNLEDHAGLNLLKIDCLICIGEILLIQTGQTNIYCKGF